MTAPVPECSYCGEPARWRVSADGSDQDIFACDDHEERAIVESGSGAVEEITPALRVIRGGKPD